MIHAFSINGINIILDINSNAVHVVDEIALKIIADRETRPVDEIRARYGPEYGLDTVDEILLEVDALIEKGLLFAPDPLPEGYNPPENDTVVKALCLHLAHDCNLRCRYCFAGQGKFGGGRDLMSLEVGRAALQFLMSACGERKHVEVDFFGGEPLLNKKVLVELVDYGRNLAQRADKEIKFTLTTNTLLFDDEMQRFSGDNGLAVVLSIDGRPEVHDRMRPAPGGGGSYERVLERISRFVNSPYCGEHYIRGTFTRHNLDFSEDVKHLAELGFNHISVEPVVAGVETDYALRDEDVPVLLAEYEKLTQYLLERQRSGRPVDFFHFNVDLEGGPCLPKRLTGCSAGQEYLAVTPQGELYPCHQFVGRRGYSMGSVFDGWPGNNNASLFNGAHIYNKADCMRCWAKFHCSGGCHANALSFNGDLLKPYRLGCTLARKRLECALYLKAAAVESNN